MRVTAKPELGFYPKRWEEREVPMPAQTTATALNRSAVDLCCNVLRSDEPIAPEENQQILLRITDDLKLVVRDLRSMLAVGEAERTAS